MKVTLPPDRTKGFVVVAVCPPVLTLKVVPPAIVTIPAVLPKKVLLDPVPDR